MKIHQDVMRDQKLKFEKDFILGCCFCEFATKLIINSFRYKPIGPNQAQLLIEWQMPYLVLQSEKFPHLMAQAVNLGVPLVPKTC